jgi:hypothetical protein
MCFLKASVDFQQTTWRYMPEGSTLQDKVVPVFKQYTVNMVKGGDVRLYTFVKIPCS